MDISRLTTPLYAPTRHRPVSIMTDDLKANKIVPIVTRHAFTKKMKLMYKITSSNAILVRSGCVNRLVCASEENLPMIGTAYCSNRE